MGGGDGAGESIMVKLVVSDLDGTLIDSSEQLTDTAREMARWLKDRNVLFTFATGRVQGMTERYAQDMQVSIPYVATNGAALIAPDGVLFRRKVPLKPLEAMLRTADCMGMSIIYSEDGYEKVCRETPYILRQRAAFGRYNDVAPLTQADYDGKQMEKICVMDSDKTGDKIDYVEDFIRRLGDQYSYTRYGDKAVEIVHPGCTKAAGVAAEHPDVGCAGDWRRRERFADAALGGAHGDGAECAGEGEAAGGVCFAVLPFGGGLRCGEALYWRISRGVSLP